VRQLPNLVRGVEPTLAAQIALLKDRLRNGIAESVRVTTVLEVFAALGLFLSVLSLYGLVSYSTARKGRESAIREALGAPPARLIWLAMRAGLQPLAIGCSLGFLSALILGNWLAAQLPRAQGIDPTRLCVVALTLGATGCLAILVPARRALSNSLPTALKVE
jgi:ABC-type antimicrobial peptide transport system permease subunit